VTRRGTQLFLNGKPYRVLSVNAYELATYWTINQGCGGMLTDAQLDAFFASLPANTSVRMWGFQGSMATNPSTHARDWRALDRVINAASRHGDHLVVSLGNQAGDCDDGHWKDAAWYRGGYRNVYPGDGYSIATVSYWDWVHEIVSRYRSSTAIAMWELVNEPEASDCAAGYASSNCWAHLRCPDSGAAAAALRDFFDKVGTEIKRFDSNHLVESGALGGSQCGWTGDNFTAVQASPGIDVMSYHDYWYNQVLAPELSTRLQQAHTLGKPLLIGELGIPSSDTAPGCIGAARRRDLVTQKAQAMFGAGAASILLWDWLPDPSSTCTYDIGPGNPVLSALRTDQG
jgi:hypothetical protein